MRFMRNYLLLTFSLAFTALGTNRIYGRETSGTQLNVSYPDPIFIAVVDEIKRKQDNIKELIYTDKTSIRLPEGGGREDVSTVWSRGQKLLYARTVIHGVPEIDLLDGRYHWHFEYYGPKGYFKTAKIYRADLAQLEKNGVLREYLQIHLRKIQHSIFSLSTKSVLLIKETQTEWVFAVRTPDGVKKKNPQAPEYLRLLTYNKENGLCMRDEFTDVSITTKENIQINPAKRIPDETFRYRPISGTKIDDITSETIKRFQKIK